MGWFSSSEEIESKGEINKNVIIDDKVKNKQHEEVINILYVLVAIIVIGFLVKIFQMYNKQLKKKYLSRSRDNL